MFEFRARQRDNRIGCRVEWILWLLPPTRTASAQRLNDKIDSIHSLLRKTVERMCEKDFLSHTRNEINITQQLCMQSN